MTFHKQLPIHLCHVIVATLGQISPETATVFQLLQCSFVTFWSWVILPILVQKTFTRGDRRRKRRVLAYHASARTLSWRRFYRSAWPIRLRLQTDVPYSLWLRSTIAIFTLIRLDKNASWKSCLLFKNITSSMQCRGKQLRNIWP